MKFKDFRAISLGPNYTLVGELESALDSKEYALRAFLDILGAYNNIPLDSIIKSL